MLTSQEVFEKLKVKDNVELECEHCGGAYVKIKKRVLDAIRYDKNIKFCSQKCSKESCSTTAEYPCACCGKTLHKRTFEINASGLVYCSRSCSAKSNNVKYPKRVPEGICSLCSDRIPKKDKTCKNCRESYYGSDRAKTWTIGQMRELFNLSEFHGRVRYYNRAWNSNKFESFCMNCGYDKHTELCHIKPVAEFKEDDLLINVNSGENNLALCPNCHWEFDHLDLTIEKILENYDKINSGAERT